VRTRKRWYTDELVRVSTAKLKVELGPARWRATSLVRVEADGFASRVRVIDVAAPSAHGGRRRFLICPACSRRCTTLGLVPGAGWCCRTCGGWRGRERRRVALAPTACAFSASAPQ
jgi:hypothetical protein